MEEIRTMYRTMRFEPLKRMGCVAFHRRMVCVAFLIFSFSHFLILPAQAQVKIGVKGGINLTDMTFDEKVFDTSNRLGYFIGPSVVIGLPVGGLGLDISGFYEKKENKINGQSIEQENMVVPINGRLMLGISDGLGIFLSVGPQFAFNIGDSDFRWDKDNVENTFQLKKSFLSVNLGGGVFLGKHLELGFTYNISVSTTGDASWVSTRDAVIKESDTKAKAWTLNAAYYF